jgi:hypothetical protein
MPNKPTIEMIDVFKECNQRIEYIDTLLKSIFTTLERQASCNKLPEPQELAIQRADELEKIINSARNYLTDVLDREYLLSRDGINEVIKILNGRA